MAFLLLVALALTLASAGPPALDTTTRATPSSLARARADVQALTREPGQTGSEGNAQRRRYILEQLARADVRAEVQSTDSVVSLLGRVVGARVNNVVARVPGRERGPAVLLSAHYDAVPNSPGAGDDAAGVATLLETARVLAHTAPLRRDVVLLFTDGEELGLLGAEAFVSQHPLAREVGWALNFEARGSRGASAMYETSLPNAGLVRSFSRAAPRPVGNSLISSLAHALPNDTDFTVYRRAGMAGLAFAFAEGLEHYHRATDAPNALEPGSLAHHLSYAVALTRELAEAADVSRASPSGEANRVYFDVLGRLLVSYPEWLARALGLLTLLLWGYLVWVGGRTGVVRARGVGWGVGGLVGSALGAMVAVSLLEWLWARGLDVPLGQRVAWAQGLLLAHLSLALLVAFEVYRRLLGRASSAELELGSWGLAALLAALLATLAPGTSFAPALSALPGLAGWWWRRVRTRSADSHAQVMGVSALALLPAVFFAVTVGYALFVLVGTQLPAASVLAVVWGMSLLLPWAAELWRPYTAKLQLALAALAVVTAATTVVLHRARPTFPTFTDLVYRFDARTGRARYDASSGLSQEAVRQRAQAKAPPSSLPASQLSVVSREPLPAQRFRQTLRLEPAPGARCITLTQLGGGRVVESRINGHRPRPNVRFSPELDKKLWSLVTGQQLPSAFNLGYCGASREPVLLELVTTAPGLFFEVTDAHDGLPQSLDLPRLEPELHFDINGNRTLIERRVQL